MAAPAAEPPATEPPPSAATTAERQTEARRSPIAAWRDRNYRLLLIGNGLSQAGDQMELVARGWLVLTLTDSPFALGLVAAATGLPRLFLALFAGVLADRFDRRTLLFGCAAINLAIATFFAVMVQGNRVNVWGVLGIVLVSSVFSTLNFVVRQAIIPDVVAPENVGNAVALNQSVRNTTQIVAQSMAGIFIAWIGVAGVLYLNAASFLALLVALLLMRITPAPAPTERLGFRADLLAGLGYVFRNKDLLPLMAVALLPFIFLQPYRTMMPVFARDVLNVGAAGYGILMAAPGFGGLVAAAAIATWNPRRHGVVMLGALFATSLALVLFALVPSFVFAVVMLALVGAGFNTYRITNSTVIQLVTPRNMMGRVVGIYNTDRGFLPLGSLIVGGLVDALGAPIGIAIPAVVCAVMTVVLSLTRPRLRRL